MSRKRGVRVIKKKGKKQQTNSLNPKFLTCFRISRNCLILFIGVSRFVIDIFDELFVIEVELLDVSIVDDGIDVFDIPGVLSRKRRLLGGKVVISLFIFDCLILIVELFVLLPSPMPVLDEHELTPSIGFIVV